MIYALMAGDKIRATPNATAICPECGADVVAKCGRINVWHWAHKQREDCDLWTEPETPWHLNWKECWDRANVERVIEKDGIKHRADIITSFGVVIELQHSPISVSEIEEREAFYGNMLWVFDAREPYEADRLMMRKRDNYWTFRWKHPRKHLGQTSTPAWLDLGNDSLFLLRKMHDGEKCGGWGTKLGVAEFIQQLGGDPEQLMRAR